MGKLVIGINDLETYCKHNNREDLLKEWDIDSNTCKPCNVAFGSNKKVSWKCSQGHIWQQSPNARTLRKHNCPYCSNQLLLKGFNDLETKNPLLASEWNYKKNVLKPSEVIAGSTKKYWWKCKLGHSWSATISHRQTGRGCPYCSNKLLLVGFNDLASTYPKIAAEWDYDKNGALSPMDVFAGSSKMIWWKCKEKHSFRSTLNNRTTGKTGCPFCAGKKVLKGFNDLETWCNNNNQQTLLEEWDYNKNDCKPSELTPNSHYKAWWICIYCKDSWKAPISTRLRYLNVFGCKKCATKNAKDRDCKVRAMSGESLADKYPEILKDWDKEKNTNIKPTEILSGSNKKVWWKCSKGHSYKASVNTKVGRNGGCPYCSNKLVLSGYNDLATINPLLSEEWDYNKNFELKPFQVVANSNKSVWWKCKDCGNEWKTSVLSRNQGSGCPRCARELQTSFPEQAIFYYLKKVFSDAINGDYHLGKELDIYIPSQKIAVEYDGAKWHKDIRKDMLKNRLCKENGIKIIRVREKECPYINEGDNCFVFEVEKGCETDLTNALYLIFKLLKVSINIDISKDRSNIYSQYLSIKHDRSLAVTYPHILKKWDYTNNIISPNHVYPGSHMKMWWICEKGHHYQQTVNSVVRGRGCPVCKGNQVLYGYNDFETWCKNNEYEYLLSEWDYEKNNLKPSEITKSSSKKNWWLCSHGHSYQAFSYNRIKGAGCPVCAGKSVLKGYNDFETWCKNNKCEYLLFEWDYEKNDKNPVDYTKGSNKSVNWICSKKHSFQARISSRTRGRGCPICAGKVSAKVET